MLRNRSGGSRVTPSVAGWAVGWNGLVAGWEVGWNGLVAGWEVGWNPLVTGAVGWKPLVTGWAVGWNPLLSHASPVQPSRHSQTADSGASGFGERHAPCPEHSNRFGPN